MRVLVKLSQEELEKLGEIMGKDIVVQKIETYSPVEDGGTVGCDTA